MTDASKRVLFWTPRILTIAFILFLGLFALDVFDEGYGFFGTIVALFMHLIPHMILTLILVVAWRREWVGGILFFGLGVFYILWAWGRFPLAAYVFISGPLFLVGILFLLNWTYRKELGEV
jgi:hypothetical protein